MNSYRLRRLAFGIFCACAAAVPVAAQSADPIDSARVQLGPLGITPSVSLRNLGVDSNVFNTVEDPKRDFTVTLSPQLSTWFRAGRSRLSVVSRADLVYFQRYASERSVDGDYDARWQMSWNRLTPWISGRYTHARQRAGYEIDVRSNRVTENVGAGAELRVASKTRVAISGQRTAIRYDSGDLFLGTSLHEVLNRRSSSAALRYSQSLTVLTTLVVEAETLRDRFDYSPARDANSARVQAGFDLATGALISGYGRIGYRHFNGVGGGLPAFRGLTANVDAGATLLGRARLDVAAQRDVAYSIELDYPYYVQTGATVTVTPQLTDKWDVQGRIGRQRLAYQTLMLDAAVGDRTDHYALAGGGIGYHLGRQIRLAFNVDRERRASPLQSRDYRGYRIGTSVTYGR